VTPATPFGRDAIESILPHRAPFLLLDEVVEMVPGERVAATYRVPEDGWWFAGHFPERPVMPGVLIVEAMAQTGAVAVLAEEENRGRIAFFAGIDDCRFKRVVSPGDTLRLEVTMEKLGSRFGRGRGIASVDGEVACEATLSFVIPGEGVLR